MKFTYFKADHMTTIEEAKRQYHRLCLRWHPDRAGGDLEVMKVVNAEWDYLRKHNYNIHETAGGGTYTDWTQDAQASGRVHDGRDSQSVRVAERREASCEGTEGLGRRKS